MALKDHNLLKKYTKNQEAIYYREPAGCSHDFVGLALRKCWKEEGRLVFKKVLFCLINIYLKILNPGHVCPTLVIHAQLGQMSVYQGIQTQGPVCVRTTMIVDFVVVPVASGLRNKWLVHLHDSYAALQNKQPVELDCV